MSFDAHQDTINRLLSNSIYRVPRNQRAYVWNERNWSDLDKDIDLVVEGVSSSHFIGSIVLNSEDIEAGLPVYTVIDGQQRLVTLTLVITAVLYELKRRGMLADASGTVKYLRATDDSGEQKLVVSTGSHLTLGRIIDGVIGIEPDRLGSTSLTAFIASVTVDKKRDANIVKAFRYFVKTLGNKSDGELLEYRNAVVSIQYVRIASSTEEDSYTIFEILNARGMELEDHELLKNYIMRYISPAERRDDAKQVWAHIEGEVGEGMKDFLRHFAIQRFRLSSSDRGVYKKIRDFSDPREAQALLYDLNLKAGYYKEILNPNHDRVEYDLFSFFKSQRVKVYRPLLLSLMHRHEDGSIGDDDYAEALRFLRTFYICHKVIGGLDSNQLTDSICKHAYDLEMTYKPESLTAWKDSFRRKLPTSDAMRDALLTLGWSNHWGRYEGSSNKDRCKLVIELLEEAATGCPVSAEYTIEHVLPDAEGPASALVGNMIPLEPKLNNRCADKPLEEKLAIYAESNFATARYFARRYEQVNFDVRVRTEHVAKKLYELVAEAGGAQ